MSGPAVIRHLIAHDSALITLMGQFGSSVTAATVKVGKLKANTPLPAISIRLVSGFDQITVAMTESKRMRTQRVQVMVHCKTERQQILLLAAVLAACPDTKGTLASIHVDSILPDGEGADLSDPDAEIYEQSRDFIVRWHPAA